MILLLFLIKNSKRKENRIGSKETCHEGGYDSGEIIELLCALISLLN